MHQIYQIYQVYHNQALFKASKMTILLQKPQRALTMCDIRFR